jgi:transcriptional regulatory protein LEU3
LLLTGFQDNNLSRFFEHHHHFLDIIDSSVTPDSCYIASPVLFWAIISVAARQYGKRPQLFSSLNQPVTDLIWRTITVLPHSRHAIKAILLISMWPFPTNSMSTDMSFMLVNMAKTASMQLGLHRPETVQDFLRVKTKLNTVQFQKAVKIWAGCYIASQW